MSRELVAFRRFRDNIRWLEENTELKHYFENNELHLKEDLDIIETTLERLEDLQNKYNVLENEYFDQKRSMLNYDEVKQIKLKALEIIKRKKVNTGRIFIGQYNTLEEYNMWENEDRKLTQEDFDLLKEILL